MPEKTHVSIVICGHVDAGKSTTTGHLIFGLDGISQREMDKLKAEADALGKSSFAFAFYMDRQKEERERGVTIACTTKEFFTATKHYTVIDAPGHRDFIKNMITGAAQADVALIMIPADGNFATSIAKGNHKTGEVQGQTRQHSLLINLLGVKQIIVGVNKMDCDVAKYSQQRYDEVSGEMRNMLPKVGWKKDFVKNSVPFLPISGWRGDNLFKESENMPWWKGCDIVVGEKKNAETVHVHTLVDALEKMVRVPSRPTDKEMRTPISGVYNIKGVGSVLTGRIEQGLVKPEEEVIFIPTHTSSTACAGKVFSIEMHHKSVSQAGPGDNVGLNIKNLPKANMPHVGDVMVRRAQGDVFGACKKFTATVQILNHPNEIKVGYTPIGYVRTGRSAVKMVEIKWRIGKETGNQKQENPAHIKAGEMAQLSFEPIQPFACDAFTSCEGLGRIAIMEGNSVVMLGKITSVEMEFPGTGKKK